MSSTNSGPAQTVSPNVVPQLAPAGSASTPFDPSNVNIGGGSATGLTITGSQFSAAAPGARYPGFELSTFYSRPASDYQVVGSGSSAAVDTSVARSGSQTLKVTCNRGSATITDINPLHAWTNFVTFAGRVGVWAYIPDYTLLSSVILKVSHGDATFTNGAFQTYSFADGDKMYNGWHFIGFDKGEMFGVFGTPDWTLPVATFRLTITQSSAASALIYFDKFVAGWRNKPKFMVMADDGFASWFTYAIPIMDSLGLKSTHGVIGAHIDSNATWATSAQLASAYANGHDLAVHGALSMADASFTTDAQRLADIRSNRTFLTSRGYTRASDFYVWPNGVYRLAGDENRLLNLIKGEGFRAARGTTVPKFLKTAAGAPDSKYLMPVIGSDAATTTATIAGLIDNAITYGSTGVLMYHEILPSGASGGTQRNLSDFIRDMEYLAQKRDAGLIDVITASQFMAGPGSFT